MNKQHFILAICIYVCAVFYLAITTPISPHEANIFYTSEDILATFMHWGDALVGGFIGLRLFFILFGFLTVTLFFVLSRRYFSKEEDAYLSTIIFMFLPGILTATTLVNSAILVLPLVLLFVLMYEKGYLWILPLIMLALFFIHDASIIFFVALLLYGIVHKDKKLSIASSAFLLAFVYLSKGIEIGGGPSGHFVEVFGLYASVFSPLLFLYFFYAMYRILLREKKSLIWYISFTALAFSFLLSVRQRVQITDFAPYVMISIILMLDIFNKSVRVRLPVFQRRYKRAFVVVIVFLGMSASLILFHKVTYRLSGNSDKHFAKRIYKPYFLAKKLQKEKILCYTVAEEKVQYQLRYYGILPCHTY